MITAIVPGSTYLWGEHAILQGHRATLVAVAQYLSVCFIPNSRSKDIQIQSHLGQHTYSLIELAEAFPPEFRFVCHAIKSHRPPTGGTLIIRSEFSHKLGLGSSAAVTVATMACMKQVANQIFTKQTLLEEVTDLIRKIEGIGSGGDVAASIFGGVISYQTPQKAVVRQPSIGPLSLHYCGYKTATKAVLAHIGNKWQHNQNALTELYQNMGRLSEQAETALKTDQSKQKIAKYMNAYHACLVQLGVEDEALCQIRKRLMAAGALAVKISGSGLGDCLIALGVSQQETQGADNLAVKISPHGLRFL